MKFGILSTRMSFDEIILRLQQTVIFLTDAFKNLPPFKRTLLVIFIASTIPGYFIARLSSQAYYDSRYKPLIISAKQSFNNQVDITAGPVTLLTLGNGVYAAYAVLENPNFDLSANNAKYEFNFFNRSGEKVYTKTDIFYILPNQKKYIVLAKFETTEVIVSGTISVSEVHWQKKMEMPKVPLKVNQPSTYNQINPQAFVVEGTVQNDSAYNVSTVILNMLLYSTNGTVLAVSRREEYSLKPHELRAYKQLWPDVYSTDVDHVVVIPETNTGSNANLQSQTSSSGASGLQR